VGTELSIQQPPNKGMNPTRHQRASKIGFDVFVGVKQQRQIVWSDTIVFPKTFSMASH
jgi:hypothetical protein